MKKIKFYGKWGFLSSLVLAASSAVGLFSVFFFQVYFGDDSYLKKSSILARINEETSIYYVDEETRLGSFFDQQHRRYVPIDEVPAHMINAIIASEDKYYYDHTGVNPLAIVKAIFEGAYDFLTSGRIHFRGGSTITQQTVKNLLDRKEYSLKRKFREAIAALQLERLYDKKQILEFYFNQFHVASNGNGIGIAAQYYFNKDVADLTLIEAAFIAGSVKGPSKYNPFIQYTPEARKTAWKYANERKNYVIQQMYEQGWISEAEFKEAWDQPVPFNKGKFTSREVALVALIRGQMNRKEILDAVGIEDVNELNQAGLKIITTLDADIQQSAQLMMRRNLSRLETILQGFKPEPDEQFKPIRDLEINEFYYGKVEKVVYKDGKPEVQLDFGLPKAVIPYESLVRYAKLMDLAVPIGFQQRLKELVTALKPGAIVFVEAREYDRETHMGIVELQKKPLVNGAILVTDRGEMRAVVSGFDPEGYNRAIFGKRQPGSVFKSVSYFAAQQLGWSILDSLDNERRLYPYQGQFYYPRPDHYSPYNDVSMIWSGVKSENLASIYLTDRLVDKLNLDQFKGVMGVLGLLPNEGESKRDFHYRVARKVGVQLDNDGIKEQALENAISDVASELIFSGEHELMRKLQKMWWGRGHAAELNRLYTSKDETFDDRERLLRIDLVKNNYQRLNAQAISLQNDWEMINSTVEERGSDAVLGSSELKAILSRFRVIPGRGSRPALGYFRSFPEEEPNARGTVRVIVEPLPGRALNAVDVQSIWGSNSVFGSSANIALSDVRLQEYLPLKIFNKLQNRLEQRYAAALAVQEPYDLPQYFHHHDFRIAVGLEYLKKLCEQMGVFSKLEPVLSFPLGTNVVSVAEVAKIYQTFTEGKIYRFYKEGPPNQLNFIKRIEDRDGNVLFEPKREDFQLIDPLYASDMQQILRKTVTHGTGSRARGELYLKVNETANGRYSPVRIPAFGKTGTTNDYTTASFAGFIPYPTAPGAPLDPKNSYVLASYVGYDLNRKMTRGGFSVTGSQGALPVWTDLAKDIIEKKKYIESLDKLDLKVLANQEWPLNQDKNSAVIKVDLARGSILRQDDGPDNEQFATTDISATGEEFVNEFAMTAGIKTALRLPTDSRYGNQVPIRAVIPFKEFKTEEQIVAEKQQKSAAVQFTFSPRVEADGDDGAGKSSDPTDVFKKPQVSVNDENARRVGLPNNTVPPPTPPTPPPAPTLSTDDLLKQIESQQGSKTEKKSERPAESGFTEEELW